MTYVKCIKNKAYLGFKDAAPPDEELIDLTVGHVYKALPESNASESGTMRIIDNSGEDYLYPAAYFEQVDFSSQPEEISDSLTIQREQN